MAQTGFTPIQLYSSSTPASAPSAGNLTNDTKGSELAVNIADGKLFYKDSTNNVQTLADKNWIGTVTNVSALTIGTTGTDLSSTVANSTSTPVITLNVPTASAANRGALSSTDWSTFNNKQAALVSGTNIKTVSGTSLLGSGDLGTIGTAYGGTGLTSFTANRVLYASSTSAISQSANLTFDGTNFSISGPMGIGTAANGALAKVYLSGTSGTPPMFIASGNGSNTTLSTVLALTSDNTTYSAKIQVYRGVGSYDLGLAFRTVNSSAVELEAMRIHSSGGVSIGNTTDPGATNLSVTGSISSGSRAITKASMPTGSILQVVQTATSIFTSTTSATFASTGLSAAITPTSSTSKILVLVMANYYGTGYQTQATIYRDSTNLAGANGMLMLNSSGFWSPLHMSYLDSPATTSSTTYAVYWRTTTGSTNYFGGDGSQTITITLLEVAA